MVVTDDNALADKVRSLRNLCSQPASRFVHERLDWNYRMINMQAALSVVQLERLDAHVARKRRMGQRYTELFSDLLGVHGV